MRLMPIMRGGSNIDGLHTDGIEFVPEDEVLASGVLGLVRSLVLFEKELRETPDLTKEQRAQFERLVEQCKSQIQEQRERMEDPTFATTLFLRDRAEGFFPTVDVTRWMEALAWVPQEDEKKKDE